MRFLVFLSLSAALLMGESETAKILVVNPQYEFTVSHKRFMGSLADLLAADGHQVTMYQALNDHDTLSSGSQHPEVKIVRVRTNVSSQLDDAKFHQNIWTADPEGEGALMDQICSIFEESCERQLKNEHFMGLLEKERFDVGIAELFDSCGFAVFERIGLRKTITVFTAMLYDNIPQALGLPLMPSYVPSMRTEYGPQMTFLERLDNFWQYVTMTLLIQSTKNSPVHGQFIDAAYQRATGQPFSTLERAMSSLYIFVNSEEHLEYPRPLSPKIVYIGGFNHRQGHHAVPEFIDGNLLEKTEKGVFLVSFGSVAKTAGMPAGFKTALLEAFSRFPEVTFLWKNDHLDGVWDQQHLNVYYQKWFSQNDILGYNRTLGILTHGGLNTVIEVAHSGVPSIAIPLFADQFRNVALITYRRIGVSLKLNELTADSLVQALDAVINGNELRANAQKLARRVVHKPLSARERVLRYVRYTADHVDVDEGAHDYLDTHGRHLSLVQLYNLDVYLFVLTVGGLAGYCISKICIAVVLRILLSKNGRKDGIKRD